MKLIYIAFIGLMFSGCTTSIKFENDCEVKSIESSDKQGICKYSVNFHGLVVNDYFSHYFYDSCGKFQIGDIVQTIKKL